MENKQILTLAETKIEQMQALVQAGKWGEVEAMAKAERKAAVDAEAKQLQAAQAKLVELSTKIKQLVVGNKKLMEAYDEAVELVGREKAKLFVVCDKDGLDAGIQAKMPKATKRGNGTGVVNKHEHTTVELLELFGNAIVPEAGNKYIKAYGGMTFQQATAEVTKLTAKTDKSNAKWQLKLAMERLLETKS